MLRQLFKLLLFSFFFLGCVSSTPKLAEENTLKLSKLLSSLNTQASSLETMQLSRDISYQTKRLSQEFKMTSPPQYHNFLVNIRVRDKGLCYHWSDALYEHFSKQNYPSFEFHLVGANIGEYWSEHNSLVIVAKGMKIRDGVIIDPWRNGGKLYFSKVTQDTEYLWRHRPSRGCSKRR